MTVFKQTSDVDLNTPIISIVFKLMQKILKLDLIVLCHHLVCIGIKDAPQIS